MSDIRRQSIISSFIVYFGFLLGFINTYLFTREGSFTQSQYGLVSVFISVANIMFSFANLGMQAFIHKFYPYYKDNLSREKNDMISWALAISLIGFTLVIIAGFVFKDFVIQKYITNAPDLVKYYYWLFPFGFGLTVFMVLEAYAWQEKESVLTNFLKEAMFRILTTLLIVLFFAGIIPRYEGFIKLYSLTYIILSFILLIYLVIAKKISFHLYVSRVTRKFHKKIITLSGFVWSGGLVFNIANVFDTLVLAAVLPNGMAYVAVYSLAQNVASLIQAPQRGVISASIGPLSRAWKDKDYEKIKRIYQRSSINQLIFAVAMFSLIIMNFHDGIATFSLREGYIQALPVFIFIGLMRVLDLGTGLNSQIIATSVYWRFEFFTGMILLSLALPLNYYLTKTMGVVGPAIANLAAFTIYNFIRCGYLWKKIRMHPFNANTLYAILLGTGCYFLCFYLFDRFHGFGAIAARSSTYIVLFGAGVIYLKLSPDILPVFGSIRKKISRRS